jgi:hypothetical protein
MNREELRALRSAIDSVLSWPESVIVEVARWLANPPKASGNGHVAGNGVDRHAAKRVPKASRLGNPNFRKPPPHEVKAAEAALLEAVHAHPGTSAPELAASAGQTTSGAIKRLGRMAKRGEVEKANGAWRAAGAQPAPFAPPPS